MTLLRDTLRFGRDVVLGKPRLSVMDRIIRNDNRWSTFVSGVEYLNYENVEGDILEFGVFTGLSLALLAKAQSFDPKGISRRVVGFDSFQGLPASSETHARWREADCAQNLGWHPFLREGARVTPQAVFDLFQACGLPPPILEVGRFEEALSQAKYPAVALLHVDCDLYESAHNVLFRVAPSLQDGALALFDDWFHYKGNPGRGEARAFREFLEAHPGWGAVQYRPYATFGNAFILYRK